MKRLFPALLGAAVALALVPTALAKGPSEASIDGPGLASPIEITATGERAMAPGAPMMEFAEATGFFPAVFSQHPDPMLPRRPEGDLGPRYRVEYSVPGPYDEESRILQDLYPYAKPSPVTYTAPGQPFFATRTRGGWFAAMSEPSLLSILTDAGLPRTPPGTDGGSPFPWTLAGVVVAVGSLIALGTLAVVRTRRRPYPAL